MYLGSTPIKQVPDRPLCLFSQIPTWHVIHHEHQWSSIFIPRLLVRVVYAASCIIFF